MILALYGAGAMGREFKYMADASGNWEEIVFIDDNARTEELMGCRVLKFRSFSSVYTPEKVRFVVAIGEPRFRMEAFERMKRAGDEGAVLCDPTAYVSPDAEVGEGTAVCRDAYVGSLCRVGRNVYISAKAAVGHEVRNCFETAVIAEFPKNESGKILYGKLQDMAESIISEGK